MTSNPGAWWPGYLKWILISVCVVGGLLAVYYWVNYTDDEITVGHGYGFAIGQSKREAFMTAADFYRGKDIYVLFPLDRQHFGPHKKLEFTEDEFRLIQNRNTWELYFDTKNYFNLLRVEFDDKGEIESIYRHEQVFELP